MSLATAVHFTRPNYSCQIMSVWIVDQIDRNASQIQTATYKSVWAVIQRNKEHAAIDVTQLVTSFQSAFLPWDIIKLCRLLCDSVTIRNKPALACTLHTNSKLNWTGLNWTQLYTTQLDSTRLNRIPFKSNLFGCLLGQLFNFEMTTNQTCT